MTILFIILGVWFAMALLMVFALVAAARRPACFDPDASPVPAVVAQEKSAMDRQKTQNSEDHSSRVGDEGELPAT
jgi:hypothetical protein